MWKAENLAMLLPNYMAANRPKRNFREPERYGFGDESSTKAPAKKPKVSPNDMAVAQPYVDENNDLDDLLLLPTKSAKVQQVLRTLSCGTESCNPVELGKVFGYPKTFGYALKLRRFGKPSENGFVHGIKYQRELGGTNVESNAVLKSSQNRFADNLVYEYLAGIFLNKYVDKLPSLIATFGLYKYTSESKWNAAQEFIDGTADHPDSPTSNVELICDATDPQKCYPDNICSQSKSFCLLIQNVKNGKSLDDLVQEYKMNVASSQLKIDIMSSLFHVYFTLAQLHSQMTHYDLHTENVMLYKPFGSGKGIRYIYHFKEGDITFTSEYLSKMIDYGRSYFTGAKELLEKIALSEDCNGPIPPKTSPKKKPAKPVIEKRGMESGFTFHNDKRCNDVTYYICPDQFNESHDLRLAYLTKKEMKKIENHPLQDFHIEYLKETGTPSLSVGKAGKINNVREMLVELRKWFKENASPPLKVVATIHIYEDMTPMRVE